MRSTLQPKPTQSTEAPQRDAEDLSRDAEALRSLEVLRLIVDDYRHRWCGATDIPS